MLVVDPEHDYLFAFFARNRVGRFVPVDCGIYQSAELAVNNVSQSYRDLLPRLDELLIQGDTRGKPIDFFAIRGAAEKLNPRFRRLTTGDDFLAARSIIGAMMHWYEDSDGNFIEQFQTQGFDSRLWELYLFAALTESGLQLERPNPAPDLLARGIHGEFALEATTINPTALTEGQTGVPHPRTVEEIEEYIRGYLPIRYAGPLTNKLAKRYWDGPSSKGKPLVFAIQDFHAPGSMRYSVSALPMYLYGAFQTARRDGDGRLAIDVTRIEHHKWEGKVVPSGFFSLPDAENISAIVFNSSGTINKFNRMGVGAGFGSPNITLIRSGTLWNPDPDSSTPISFEEVVAEGNPETWIEGMDVYHNPNAKYPLDSAHLPGAAHHRLLPDLHIETTCTGRKPIQSGTEIRRTSHTGGCL
ncbi:hypothetical protein JYB55_26030 [Mycolicibacterium septicum]|nr:hypothetical protein [Mycolicibacterium septicum]